MVYANAQELNQRYATKLSATELSDGFLPFASARLDAMLAPYFTVPFAANNLTAKDLTIDLAYLLVLQRSKDSKDYEALKTQIQERINSLMQGRAAMITTDGQALFRENCAGEVWSNTSGGTPLCDLDASLA